MSFNYCEENFRILLYPSLLIYTNETKYSEFIYFGKTDKSFGPIIAKKTKWVIKLCLNNT